MISATLFTALCAHALPAAPHPGRAHGSFPAPSVAPGPAGEDDGKESLESLLERARNKQAALHAALESEVAALVEELEDIAKERGRPGLSRIRKALLALGPEAAPLLVASIDPGSTPRESHVFRAAEITATLQELPQGAIVERLIQMLGHGTLGARRNAARVLGHSDHPERAREALREAFEGSVDELQEVVLESLLSLPGDPDLEFLDELLTGKSSALANLALGALGRSGQEDVADRIHDLMLNEQRAAELVPGFIEYYTLVPEAMGADEIVALADLAGMRGVSPGDRLMILDRLPDFGVSLSGSLKRSLQDLASREDADLSESALIALSRFGDRNARREFLEPHDDYIEKHDEWPNAYSRRGEAYLDIEEYSDAIKDFRKALNLARSNSTPQRDTWINLARAYALSGKLKDAATTLDDAPISVASLQALAADPDFAELAAHSKHGKVFRLGD